jgi:hypothetical protein
LFVSDVPHGVSVTKPSLARLPHGKMIIPETTKPHDMAPWLPAVLHVLFFVHG